MSEMSFRCLIDDTLCDITPFKPYAEKGDFDLGLVLIGFGEAETEIIRQLFRDNVREGYESYLDNIQLEGSDGNLYVMSRASLDKKEKMPQSIMKAYKYYYSYKKKESKSKEWIKENTAKAQLKEDVGKYENGIVRRSGGNYRYTDKENEMSFPMILTESVFTSSVPPSAASVCGTACTFSPIILRRECPLWEDSASAVISKNMMCIGLLPLPYGLLIPLMI